MTPPTYFQGIITPRNHRDLCRCSANRHSYWLLNLSTLNRHSI